MILPEHIACIEDLCSSLEMDDAKYYFGLYAMGSNLVLGLTKELKPNGANRNFVYLVEDGKILWDELRYKPPSNVIDACNRLAKLIVFL